MKLIEDMYDALPKAQRYREYLNGYAYIPLQDLSKYEKAYKLIYG